MITLYELRWSHYCEKIRMALNYMQLPWESQPIDIFQKKELKGHGIPDALPTRTVPAILDSETGQFVMDSTPILRYLAATYPDAPKLFPGEDAAQAEIDARLLEFDTQLAIAARIFAYTQLILECPQFLPELFTKHRARGAYCLPGINQVSGALLGMMLTKRFGFHQSEKMGLYEGVEQYLVSLAEQLADRQFVVGDIVSAADLALAAQLRPLTIVPFFIEHPKLQGLFARQRQIAAAFSDEPELAYQTAIVKARTSRRPQRRKNTQPRSSLPFHGNGQFADNDQKKLWTWETATIPYHYWVTLRKNVHRTA